ncbi:MAG: ribonuclease P protein component [Planctomycetes bacterium TMED75]|nr:ribonuclease P protein component [Planctomycetaceae bacterium]OUU96626.1 MAG: ribonuclease P protein component [Planctomycetes bacterium TMED75]
MPAAGAENKRFPKSHRLSSDREFQSVFTTRHRRESGPLLVYGKPNERQHPRLGLSVSRKAGGAVRRVKIKRHLREGFRTLLPQFRAAFDFIVVVRPHRPLKSEDYQRNLETAMRKVVQEWKPVPDEAPDHSPGC